MKCKVLLSALFTIMSIGVSAADVEINETNFPDENFRAILKGWPSGQDGVFTEDEILNIQSISVSDKHISSLKGIEHFKYLQRLNCGYNQLTSLDVSKNTCLTMLSCNNNQLTSLDLSNNETLFQVFCHNNQLTSLNISKTPLYNLWCDNNQLTRLDMSNKTQISSLSCTNNKLTELDLSLFQY